MGVFRSHLFVPSGWCDRSLFKFAFQILMDTRMTRGKPGKNVKVILYRLSLILWPLPGSQVIAVSSKVTEPTSQVMAWDTYFTTLVIQHTCSACILGPVSGELVWSDLVLAAWYLPSLIYQCAFPTLALFLSPLLIFLLDHKGSCTSNKENEAQKSSQTSHPFIYLCTVLIQKKCQTSLCFTTVSKVMILIWFIKIQF